MQLHALESLELSDDVFVCQEHEIRMTNVRYWRSYLYFSPLFAWIPLCLRYEHFLIFLSTSSTQTETSSLISDPWFTWFTGGFFERALPPLFLLGILAGIIGEEKTRNKRTKIWEARPVVSTTRTQQKGPVGSQVVTSFDLVNHRRILQ